MHCLYLLLLLINASTLFGAISPLYPEGDWYSNHFEFNEEPLLSQTIIQQMLLEGSTSLLDLDCIDGVLYNDAITNGVSYRGETPYPDAVARMGGVANLLDPFQYFDLGTSYDWVVCIGLAGFFPAGSESIFVGNLKRHANSVIVVTWFPRNYSSPYFINPLSDSEVEYFFTQQGLTRDMATESILRANANPTQFWPQTLYVFRI